MKKITKKTRFFTGEGKKSSKFVANETRLLLFKLFYNLEDFLITMVLPKNLAK